MRALCVVEETTRRVYALKRMRKSAVVQCPEHVFCEQVCLVDGNDMGLAITRAVLASHDWTASANDTCQLC